MAVYTELDRETVDGFLAEFYNLGPLIELEGIAEGIQNTNYVLKTGRGKFILTLFERRTPVGDLPFFFDYMAHLAKKGFPCPRPVFPDAGAKITGLAGKPAAIVTFLPGRPAVAPGPDYCFAAGGLIARLHSAGADFGQTRPNLFSPEKVADMFLSLRTGIAGTWPGLEQVIEAELAFQAENPVGTLPVGPIHTDIFPDNVFFEGGQASGLIDFYFSSTDFLAYDLAIALGSWCYKKDGGLKARHFKSMIEGYEAHRPLGEEEKEALPILLRRSSLAFLMTRVEDVLNPPPNILGVQKDPIEYRNILANQQNRRHIGDYY